MKTKATFGSINVNVAAKTEGGDQGTGGKVEALPAPEAVTDSHKSSTAKKVASITVPAGVDAGVKLVCASANTAEATKVEDAQCLVENQKYEAKDNKIYFTAKSTPTSNFLALSEDGSTISNKAKPTNVEFVPATTLNAENNTQVFITATRQSAPGNTENPELNQNITENQIKLKADNANFVFLELKSDSAKKLFKYSAGKSGALTRDSLTAPKLGLDLVKKEGTDNSKVDATAAASTNGGGKACAAQQAQAKNDGSEYLCQIKLTNNAEITPANVTIKVDDKPASGTTEVSLTGVAAQ